MFEEMFRRAEEAAEGTSEGGEWDWVTKAKPKEGVVAATAPVGDGGT